MNNILTGQYEFLFKVFEFLEPEEIGSKTALINNYFKAPSRCHLHSLVTSQLEVQLSGNKDFLTLVIPFINHYAMTVRLFNGNSHVRNISKQYLIQDFSKFIEAINVENSENYELFASMIQTPITIGKAQDGHNKVTFIVLRGEMKEPGWERYVNSVERARQQIADMYEDPEVEFVPEDIPPAQNRFYHIIYQRHQKSSKWNSCGQIMVNDTLYLNERSGKIKQGVFQNLRAFVRDMENKSFKLI